MRAAAAGGSSILPIGSRGAAGRAISGYVLLRRQGRRHRADRSAGARRRAGPDPRQRDRARTHRAAAGLSQAESTTWRRRHRSAAGVARSRSRRPGAACETDFITGETIRVDGGRHSHRPRVDANTTRTRETDDGLGTAEKSSMRLEGKKALVTGSSKGIGRESRFGSPGKAPTSSSTITAIRRARRRCWGSDDAWAQRRGPAGRTSASRR